MIAGYLLPVRGLRENTSNEFRARLLAIGSRLGIDPNWIAAVMSFETGGTFRADIRNPYSGFVGLIQFGPQAASMLGTSLDALSRMRAEDQLSYVERYFARVKNQLRTLADCYMAVFAPIGIGKGQSFALYSAPSKAYEQNRGLDFDGDGHITVGEASSPVIGIHNTAKNQPPIEVQDVPVGSAKGGSGSVGLFGLLAVAAAAVFGWFRSKKS